MVRRIPAATLATAIAASVVTLLLAISPVLADSDLQESWCCGLGIGQHHLVDSQSKPDVRCEKFQSDASNPKWWVMDVLSVRAPMVFGTTNDQAVGWRFIVLRQKAAFSGEPQWPVKVTYRSPIQTDIAQLDTPAAFHSMAVPVDTPDNGRSYNYWVRVKMFWYLPSGDVQGWSLHQADFYREVLAGTNNGVYSECFSEHATT
jgi:hypothetical protein